MNNYFEKTNLNNKDLFVEMTNHDIYLGYRENNNAKTIYSLSKDIDEIINDYTELKNNHKYKNSNLINKIEELLLLNEIKEIMDINETPNDLHNIINKIGTEKMTESRINKILENHNINCFCYKNTLIHNDYKKIIEKTEKIISDKLFFVENENLLKLLPDEYGICLTEDAYIEKFDEIIKDINFSKNKKINYYEFMEHDESNPYDFPIMNLPFLETRLDLWRYNIKFIYPNKEMKEKTIDYIECILENIITNYEVYSIDESDVILTYKRVLLGEIIE